MYAAASLENPRASGMQLIPVLGLKYENATYLGPFGTEGKVLPWELCGRCRQHG